jgi:hypothetical protein
MTFLGCQKLSLATLFNFENVILIAAVKMQNTVVIFLAGAVDAVNILLKYSAKIDEATILQNILYFAVDSGP